MDKIETLLTRGVDTIYPSKEALEKVVRSGKKLKLYQGFDPTGKELHIGHMIGLRKLRQWQELGHHVIFLIGDGTGQAGDPSGKMSAREKFFTQKELRENAKEYVMQATRLMRFDGENPAEIAYNGDWLTKLNLAEILSIAGHFTLQQLVERDLFQERMKKREPVNLREFLYPLLQGYDSVVMEVDLEVGGTDQTFNMLIGRQLLHDYKRREKFVMTTPLLTDSQGRKIGKTEDNVIGITDKPEDLYGKVMNLGDDFIIKGFEYLTDVSMGEVRTIQDSIHSGENPMPHKKHLAYEIVKQLNSEGDAARAQRMFEKVVQQGEIASGHVETQTLPSGATIVDAIVKLGFATSRSSAKRLVGEGAVVLEKTVIKDPTHKIYGEKIIRVGNRKFGKIKAT